MEEDEVTMIECVSLDDFVKYNDKDVRRIIISNFKNVLHKRHDLTFEDIIQSFYLHISRSQAVEKFDKNFGVKFSTYMYRCILNYMCAFQVKIKQRDRDFMAVSSLDEKSDDNFSKHELIAAPEAHYSFDVVAVHNELLRREKKFPYKSKVKLSDMFRMYYLGYKDADIGREYSLTSAGVGARKRELQKIVAPLLGREITLGL